MIERNMIILKKLFKNRASKMSVKLSYFSCLLKITSSNFLFQNNFHMCINKDNQVIN